MYSIKASFLLLSIILTATFSLHTSAQTPPDFSPPTLEHLNVLYDGKFNVTPAGITVPENAVNNTPNISLSTPTSGTFIAMLLDFSVQLSPTKNTTLIHWIQPGLNSQSLTSGINATVPYFPPGPPAGQAHTYGVLLYKQPADFIIPTDLIPFINNITQISNATQSVLNRIGFNLTEFVNQANLGMPVAADWFLVSSPPDTAASVAASTSGGLAIQTGTGCAGCAMPTSGSLGGYQQVSSGERLGRLGVGGFSIVVLGCAMGILEIIELWKF